MISTVETLHRLHDDRMPPARPAAVRRPGGQPDEWEDLDDEWADEDDDG